MLAAYTEDTPLGRIVKGTAPAALAKGRGVHTFGDLLDYVPRRYLPPNELTDLADLRVGDDVMVVAEVQSVATTPMRGRTGHRTTAVLTDGRRELDVTFFAKRRWDFGLRVGRWGIFAGTVSLYNRRLQLTHPEVELLDETGTAERTEYLKTHQVPVYPTTGSLGSFVIRRIVATVLDTIGDVREPVPPAVRERRQLLGRREALELVHRPVLGADVRPGLRRMGYDEAFVLQTILGQRRRAAQALRGTARMPRPHGLLAGFDARLPFTLTAGQRQVGEVIADELAAERPMHRLLQGEVGSGKTVVALRAMLAVVDAGGQAALLAPTEVLAAQHHRSITTLLGGLARTGMSEGLFGAADGADRPGGTKVALLTGSQSSAARRAALNDAITGDAGIVIGTHALIQKHVQFFDLGLVIVDEQHRFGVQQRDALREKGRTPPHLLVMTATPIPRTVAMTVFGDMETSALTELPAGRQPIDTHVVDAGRPAWVERTWARLAEEISKGHQAYVVCPTIGEPTDGSALNADTSDEDAGWQEARQQGAAPPGAGEQGPGESGEVAPPERPLASVYAVADLLRATAALVGARIEILHGRLDADTKERVMKDFGSGEIDVLVATTVIEVGVDVPNASTMVVMDADRFGLSQLHQLRGRVGRGAAKGLCLLMTAAEAAVARERLDAVAATTDGFELARRDLQLRREGDVLGARQSGSGSSVRFLRMGHRDDEELIAAAREDAFALLEEDPGLEDHPDLQARVAARLDEQQAAYLERG
ncbi:MAG: ATP-dependent DNA helicase RecG [Candidatus Phosphoribacter sp.]|nr:ATP-dependent DNA helicase RecG [Actinomycetales bacterium]